MLLFFDERDDQGIAAERTAILEDCGAHPLSMADDEVDGYLFSLSRSDFDYRRLIAGRAHLKDQPGDRAALLDWNYQSKLLRAEQQLAILATTTAQQLEPQVSDQMTAPILVSPFLGEQPEKQLETRLKIVNAFSELEPPKEDKISPNLMPLPCMLGPINPAHVVRMWIIRNQVFGYSCPYQFDDLCLRGLKAVARRLEKLAAVVDSTFVVAEFLATASGLLMFGIYPGSLILTPHQEFYRKVIRNLAGQQSRPAQDQSAAGPRWATRS